MSALANSRAVGKEVILSPDKFGLWNVIERFAMSIVGFLRDRQADILIGNEARHSPS